MRNAGLVVLLSASAALAQADVKIIPFGAPAYTPELGLLLAGGGAMTWNGDRTNPSLPRSSLTLTAGASTVGAVLFQTRMTSFVMNDSIRINANIDVRDQPDHYFGVGFENGLSRQLGATTTAMRRTWWAADPTLLARLVGPVYVGAVLHASGTIVRAPSEGVANDADYARHGGRVVSTGVGLTVQLDTRDVPINAWKGALFSATLSGYGRVAGGTSEWYSLTFDYRHYVQLFRRGSTLAWQVRYRTTLGDVPWSELTQVGTPFDLRAYRWGQYRDRTGFTALVEYRFMLPFAEESLWSHLGAAAWTGVGALSATAVPDVQTLLPSVGFGLRVELLKRVTVRLDVGFGRESRAVYFNFLEAF